ncbi:MAG: ABC transporter permease [Chloroflexi bacterium]|nr:ABC transporter permease [Chloroflexota bacterium]
MRSFGKLTWVEFKLFLREPFGFFFTLIFPLMMLFIFGSIYGNEPMEVFGGRGTMDISVPAYTAMIIAISGLMNITITLSTYRENGILRRLRTTPVSPLAVLVAQLVVIFIVTLLGMALLLIAAVAVYHVQIIGNPFSMLTGFTYCCLCFFPIGLILAGIMPTARSANIVGLVLLYPMMFFSGAGYPRELLPASVKGVGTYLPLTYVVNLLRGLWFGDSWAAHTADVLVLLGIMAAGVLVAVLTFRWE